MAHGNGRSSLGLVAAAGIVLGALLLGTGSLAYPWTQRDAASAAYIGATILEGGAPYRDAWNVKPPGINFAYALSILLFGQSAAGLRVFDLLWQTATALVVAFLAARMYGKRAAGIIAGIAYLIAYFSQNYRDWGEPDGLLSLPLALALLFFLKTFAADRLVFWALAAGATGLAALFKLPMGIVGLAFLGYAVVLKGRPIDRAFLRPLALALGFAIPFAAVSGYLYSRGALEEFVTAQFVFAPEYVARLRSVSSWSCIAHSLTRPILFFFYALAAAGIYSLLRAVARGERISPAAAVLCAWLGAAIATLVMHGAWLRYHYLPMAVPLALLAAEPLAALWTASRKRGGMAARCALVLVGLSLVPAASAVRAHYQDAWQVWSGAEAPGEWQALGTYLRERTAPGERIFVWGNIPVVYLYAERKAASRFLSTYFLSVLWRRVDYRPIFLGEFTANEPVYFVLMKEPPYPHCFDQEEGGSLGGFERFTALTKIVEEDFTIEKTESDYVVYRRKPRAGTPAVAAPRG